MIQSCRDCRALGPATAAPHSGELRAARRKVETSRKKGGAVGTTANGARRAPWSCRRDYGQLTGNI